MKKNKKKSGLADSPFFERQDDVREPATQPREQRAAAPTPSIEEPPESTPKSALESTPVIAYPRDRARELPREILRETARPVSAPHPLRDEIQTFNFQLRDSLKVKVQVELPNEWREEMEELAHTLGVKKMELYRFIYGEFLGKVKRKE